MKPALLVIDVQKGCLGSGAGTVPPLKEACARINAAIGLFREKGLPVVCIRHMDEPHGLVPGKEAFEVLDELDIQPDDLHIDKRYANAFNRTGLGEALRSRGVDTVLLSGYCAEYCVLATSIGAEDNDLQPILLRGTVISHSREQIRFVEDINELMTIGAFMKCLG